ncbi:MAG: ABC transporter ATP-binding protein [Anaerolineales bacterium]
MTEQDRKDAGNSAAVRMRTRWGSKIEKAKDPKVALHKLATYLKPQLTPILVVFVLVIVYTVLNLVGPYLMGVAIDQYISQGDRQGLARIALWMLAAYISGALLQMVSSRMMAKVSQVILKEMRDDLFSHLQSLSLRFFDMHSSGDLMSRLTNDIDAINQAVSQNITALFSSVLTLIGIIVAMFLLNPWLALVSLLVAPLMFWFTGFIAKYTRRGFRDLQANLGSLNGVMEEAISGQRVVKAFQRNQTVIASFREANQGVYQAGLKANVYALLLMPITNVLGNFFVILLVGFGAYLALKGLATVGIIATFISYGQRFIQPLRQLANMYNSIQAALAGAERVFEIMETDPELQDSETAVAVDAFKGAVKFKNVNFGYLEDVPVIKSMSFNAAPGETIALVGPTGAGKTTIINLLSRFYDIDGGSIEIDGQDIRDLRKNDLRSKLGIVLQDTFLFSTSVMENIRYGRLDATDAECIQAAKMADADYFISQLPQGYDTILSERGGNLSQGQRQLLAISRAILADPDILILDEATSSVDTRTEARIQKALLKLMEGRTSFVIAHRLSTIRDADNVLVINDGEIVENGNHQQLLAKKGFYHHLYLSQFKGQQI